MNGAFTATGAGHLAERLARCMPGASFELEALVRLVGIEETDVRPDGGGDVPGPGPDCSINPRLRRRALPP